MRITKSFKLSLNVLLHSKLRSWLTILGIIIGIAAVVAILSISEGAQQQLESRLGNLGADIITITPGFSRAMGPGNFGRGGFDESSTATDSKNLTSKDILLLKNLPNVAFIMGQISGREDLTYMTKTATLGITGVDTTVWKDITTEELSSGRFLMNGDSYSVVLGGNIVSSTFENGIPLNSQVIIGGKSFKVVGILKEGRSIYMPIDIAKTVLEINGDKFDSISVKIKDISLSNDTITLITSKLMLSHGIIDSSKKDFTVSSPTSMQETIQQTMNTMTIFLGAIAAISLIVGAVGIANTMFTSVLEKTKEIGIMKAIGARDKDVMIIFLLNAGLIGLIGGIGGLLIGIFASSAISSLGGITTSTTGGAGRGLLGMLGGSTYVSPELIIGALLFSILIGMIAGAIPAYRASKLNPVDALRYE